MIKNTTTLSFQQIMEEYQNLGAMMKNMVRNTAKLSLLEEGADEIGSSDVNHKIVGLFNTYGSFDEIIRYGLELSR